MTVTLDPTRAVASPLFQAIAERQCTRGEYDARPLPNEELGLLQRAGSTGGVQVLLLTERVAMEKVLEYVVQGNTVQMSDPAFVEELKTWIRYSGQDAVRTGDGLYGASSGNPSLPSWSGSALFGLFFTPKTENDKYAKQVRSSAGIAVFVGDSQQGTLGGSRRCYSDSPCRRLRWTSAPRSSINRSRFRPCDRNSRAIVGLGSRRPDLVVRFGAASCPIVAETRASGSCVT